MRWSTRAHSRWSGCCWSRTWTGSSAPWGSDRLRGALLTSISHDLKTPLASVLGAASTLRDLASGLTDTQKHELLATVIDEFERLNRFIANLLDMTKLELGAIVPNAAPHDVGEIVGSALRRAGNFGASQRIAATRR